MAITVKVNFSIDKNKLFYLAEILDIRKSKRKLLRDSENNLGNVKKIWQKSHKLAFNRLLNKFSGPEDCKIKVIVVPNYFYIGACEPNERIIIYGQPSRCKFFSTAIIIHEITHILLYCVPMEKYRIIDEAICFMAENIVYEELEKKSIREIWDLSELDKFHREALKISLKFFDYFSITNTIGIENIIRLLFRNTDVDAMAILPKVGLLKNLPNYPWRE